MLLGLTLTSPQPTPQVLDAPKHLLDSNAVAVSPSVQCRSGPEAPPGTPSHGVSSFAAAAHWP